MARELRLFEITGLTITANIVDAATGDTEGTASLTESPTGYYVGTFPSLPAGTYDVQYTDGTDDLGSETIIWNGTTVVSGFSVAIPDVANPDGTITLVQGDDFKAEDNRAVSFAFVNVQDLTDASVTLDIISIAGGGLIQIEGTITSPAEDPTVAFDIGHDITAALSVGAPSYHYAVIATLENENVITLATGTVTVTE